MFFSSLTACFCEKKNTGFSTQEKKDWSYFFVRKLYIYFCTVSKFRESSGILYNSKQKFIGIICYLTVFVAFKLTCIIIIIGHLKIFKDRTKTKILLRHFCIYIYVSRVKLFFFNKKYNNKKRLPELKRETLFRKYTKPSVPYKLYKVCIFR